MSHENAPWNDTAGGRDRRERRFSFRSASSRVVIHQESFVFPMYSDRVLFDVNFYGIRYTTWASSSIRRQRPCDRGGQELDDFFMTWQPVRATRGYKHVTCEYWADTSSFNVTISIYRARDVLLCIYIFCTLIWCVHSWTGGIGEWGEYSVEEFVTYYVKEIDFIKIRT